MHKGQTYSALGPDAGRARMDLRLPVKFRDAICKSSQSIGIPVGTFMALAAARLVTEIEIAGVTDEEILIFLQGEFNEAVARIRDRAEKRAAVTSRSRARSSVAAAM